MTLRTTIGSLLVLVWLAAAGAAQVALDNKPTYEVGRKSITTSTIKSRQVLNVAGNDIESQVEQSMRLSDVPQEAAADGTRPVRYAFESIKTSMKVSGLSIEFDSANPDKRHEIAEIDRILDLFRAMAKSRWTAVLGPDYLFRTLEYEGDPFGNLDQDLKREVDPKKHIDNANQTVNRLPNKTVALNETWKRTEKIDIGGGQSLEFQRELKYLGPRETDGRMLHRIGMTSSAVKYHSGDGPLKIVKSDLKVVASQAEMLYDPQLGMLTRSVESVQVSGPVTFSIGGQEAEGRLDLTLEGETVYTR
jgi:hypothetical protein